MAAALTRAGHLRRAAECRAWAATLGRWTRLGWVIAPAAIRVHRERAIAHVYAARAIPGPVVPR
jgi:hypothetical protein